MANILVVDDEMGIRALLQEILTTKVTASNWPKTPPGTAAARAPATRPGAAGHLDARRRWRHPAQGVGRQWAQLTMPVIMMSGHGTIDTAVEATKYGAMAFLEKPITLQKLLRAVEQGLAKPAPRPAVTSAMAPARLERDFAPSEPAPLSFGGYGAAPPPMASNGHALHNTGYGHALPPAQAGMAVNHTPAPTLAVVTGPLSEQSFSLDRPLREARDAFEKAYFEFHLARERWQHDPCGRKNRTGAHPLLQQS
jgi:CheY-like chemotaxis protein